MTGEREELESLLLDWEDGQLPDSGIERVRTLLRSSQECRDFFTQNQILTATLTTTSGLSNNPFPESRSVESPALHSAGTQRSPWWIVIAAVLIVATLTGRWGYLEFRSPVEVSELAGDSSREPTDEARSHGVALLTRTVDVAWEANQQRLAVGDAVSTGRFAIESGFAQLEFFCGATVIVEGPAVVNLKSTTVAQVEKGRLRAQVPPAARGFTLMLSDMTVVDLGTEFGLSVSSDGTDVQVFDGEVEIHQPTRKKRILTAGQAIVREADGQFKDAEADAHSYLNIETLASKASNQRVQRYHTWTEWSRVMRRDPRLIAYYAFDQDDDWRRRLESSNLPRNAELDGAIVGARQVEGRWPGKRALEFKRPGDRVRVQIPGQFESLTMSCWLKIDSLDRWFNSLFLTDGYDRGEPHWQVLDTGQLYFSVRPKEPGEHGASDFKALSPPFWDVSFIGRWIHLATVYDVNAQTITHFLNGRVLSEHSVPEHQIVPTMIGTASIGNWAVPTKPEAGFAIRNLNGSIDEFAIFSEALSHDEIRSIHKNGRP